MREPALFLSGLTWQSSDERIGIARDESIQSLFNLFQTRKLVQARSVATQLSQRLWTTQHQHVHQRCLWRTQVHYFGHHVLVLRHTARAAIEDVREVFIAQTFNRFRDLALGIPRNRVAVVLLIAGER